MELQELLELLENNLEFVDENPDQVIYAEWLLDSQREPAGKYNSLQHQKGYFKALGLMDLLHLVHDERVEVLVDDRALIFRVNK